MLSIFAYGRSSLHSVLVVFSLPSYSPCLQCSPCPPCLLQYSATPLHYSSCAGHLGVCQYLIEEAEVDAHALDDVRDN